MQGRLRCNASECNGCQGKSRISQMDQALGGVQLSGREESPMSPHEADWTLRNTGSGHRQRHGLNEGYCSGWWEGALIDIAA